MVSIQVLATPISGLLRSASVKPMALNMERAGARSRPSVIPRLRCVRSIVIKFREERLQHELSSRMDCHLERREGPWFLHALATEMVQARTKIPRSARDDKLRVRGKNGTNSKLELKPARPAPTAPRCSPRLADAAPRPALPAHAKPLSSVPRLH